MPSSLVGVDFAGSMMYASGFAPSLSVTLCKKASSAAYLAKEVNEPDKA
jgi:hypothetical protein